MMPYRDIKGCATGSVLKNVRSAIAANELADFPGAGV
jgi:hypothetical protein